MLRSSIHSSFSEQIRRDHPSGDEDELALDAEDLGFIKEDAYLVGEEVTIEPSERNDKFGPTTSGHMQHDTDVELRKKEGTVSFNFHQKKSSSSTKEIWSDYPFSALKLLSELYMNQKGQSFSVSSEGFKAFLRMNLVMGFHVLPSIRNYWSASPDLRGPYVLQSSPETDPRKSGQLSISMIIKKSDPKTDRACKVRPLIRSF